MSSSSGRAVIVGAGVFGASVACELAGRGWDVVVIEQHVPGHVRASSGGHSRLLRLSHGDDRWYTRWARQARCAWLELEQETGRALFVPCGVAWFAHRDDGWEAASEHVLRDEGVEVERLDPDAATGLFPSLGVDDLAFVLVEPEGGLLRARRAVRALTSAAQARGAALVTGTAAPDSGGVAVDGQRLGADVVVWACGPWLPRLFPGLVEVRVTQQDVFYFGAPSGWEAGATPAWVDYDGAAYGAGDLDGHGMKTSPDVEGADFDPDRAERVAAPENLRRARDYVARRFPALSDAPLVGTEVCQYSLTPDTEFIIAPHPEHDGVWLLGGGSGHGFKHGPAVGAYVADVLDGTTPVDARFGLTPRAPRRALRTAGSRLT